MSLAKMLATTLTCNGKLQAQPSTHSKHLATVTNSDTWAYPRNTLLATVVLVLLLDTNLLPEQGLHNESIYLVFLDLDIAVWL